MNENEKVVGCADPRSLAEEIEGKRIDWANVKDEFETLAQSFGITKESYIANEAIITSPYIAIDKDRKVRRLSDTEAQKRVSDLLTKNARPTLKKQQSTALTKKATLEAPEKSVLNVILRKKLEIKELSKDTVLKKKITEISDVESPDKEYTPTGYEWKDKGYFFNETPLWSDVCQNSIGDCYFLAALCSVVYANSFDIQNIAGLRYKYKEGLQALSPWHKIQFYVPNTNHSDYSLWNKQKKTVQCMVVSEDVLVRTTTGRNYGACGPKEKQGVIPSSKADADSCWAAVYEKAFAKFLEKTSSDRPDMQGKIRAGQPSLALKSILHTEQVSEVSLSNLSINQIWDYGLLARHRPMIATIYGGKSGYNYTANGLYTSHCYSFLGVYSSGNTKYIVLRNPHGQNPAALKNNPDVYHKSWGFNYGVNPEPEFRTAQADIYRTLGGNDNPLTSQGLFLMEINAFKSIFGTLTRYYGPIKSCQ